MLTFFLLLMLVRSDAADAPSQTAATPPPAASAAKPPQAPPGLRALRPGERRTAGTLRRIECGSNDVIIEVRSAAGRTLRFTARRLDDIDFVAASGDLRGSMGCGLVAPSGTAYVTWRPLAKPVRGGRAVTGRVIAVEFPPQ